jgi:hypothetical protein
MQSAPAVVLDNHLLNGHRRMTLISFEGGKVVMRDGKVGTEEECRCGRICALLKFVPFVLSYETTQPDPPIAWPCLQELLNIQVSKLQAAGYTVTLSRENRDDGFTYLTWTLSCECCLDCETMTDLLLNQMQTYEDGFITYRELADQPEGMWVDVMSFMACNSDGAVAPDVLCDVDGICSISPGGAEIVGCCGTLDNPYGAGYGALLPNKVNGVSKVELFGAFMSVFVPVCDPGAEWCNPLP